MSAILEALKKLEEEKTSIDCAISLKELNLDGGGDGDRRPNSLGEKLRQWRGRILLVLVGIILGALIGKFI